MAQEPADILILERRIEPAELIRLVSLFGEMVKYVADIRPSEGNPSMEVEDPAVRERIRALTFALVGEGESL